MAVFLAKMGQVQRKHSVFASCRLHLAGGRPGHLTIRSDGLGAKVCHVSTSAHSPDRIWAQAGRPCRLVK